MRQTAAVKRPRVIIGQEQSGRRDPDVIPFLTVKLRLNAGSTTHGVFQEMPGERRIPFSNGKVKIKPGSSPAMAAASEFVMAAPRELAASPKT